MTTEQAKEGIMSFEEAGRAIDREVEKLIEFLNQKVKTSGRRDMAAMLRKASERLAELAKNLEQTGDGKQ